MVVTKMVDYIIYPSIDLFLYDLKDGLGQDDKILEKNCEEFCQKLFTKDELKTKSSEFQDIEKEIKKYLKTEVDVIELLTTKGRIKEFKSPLDGYYYPLQFGDTYALRVDYSGKLTADHKPDDDPQDLDDKPFEKLKKDIQNHIGENTGTIGQTWLVWGKIKDVKNDNDAKFLEIALKIAKECYTQIVPSYNWERDFIGKGNLEKGILFELWYNPSNIGKEWDKFWQETYRKESYHVLIWLFPDNVSADEMRKAAQNVYYDLQRLFHYRHKIVWAYYQSRYQKTKLKTQFIDVQKSINEVSQLPQNLNNGQINLQNLQKTLTETLTTLSNYTVELNYLDDQNRTIKINIANYSDRLDIMKTKYINSDLKFFDKFNNEIYAQKYQRQTETDIANLTPGLIVLQNLTNTIQGIINIEDTKSERNLTFTVGVIGSGLAAIGVTATIVSTQIPTPPYPPKKGEAITMLDAFLWSIGIGLPFLLIYIFRSLRR